VDQAGPPAPERRPWRRRLRPRHVLYVLALLLIAAVVAASFWQIPYYAIVPGTALDAGTLVTVPRSVRQHHPGSVWLTDVDLVQLRAINYLFYAWNSNDTIQPTENVTGPATPAQYFQQGTIDMATARQAATVVALDHLGYHVAAVPSGVIVYQAIPGSPAAAALSVNDVIVALDGHRVRTFADLSAALSGDQPGRAVRVAVHPFGSSRSSTVTVRLGAFHVRKVGGGEVYPCLPVTARTTLPLYLVKNKPYACLGLDSSISETDYATTGLPFPVTLDPHGIIGPSAGLAYTLALMQQLDPQNLTAGRRVAATGTMSVDGQVGDVGGVAQKTVAVRNAGATVFFVPTPELAVARAHSAGKLRIFAVSDISQVLADLRSIGGEIARPASANPGQAAHPGVAEGGVGFANGF